VAVGTGTPFPFKGSVYTDYVKSDDYSSLRFVLEPPEGLAEEHVLTRIPDLLSDMGLDTALVESTHYTQAYNPSSADELSITFGALDTEAAQIGVAQLFKMIFDGSRLYNEIQEVYFDAIAAFTDRLTLKSPPDQCVTTTGAITLRLDLITGYPEDDVSVYKNIVVNAVKKILGVNLNASDYSWITYMYEPDVGTPTEFRVRGVINSVDRCNLFNLIYHVLLQQPPNPYKFLYDFLEDIAV
jgi:hypothetical protein